MTCAKDCLKEIRQSVSGVAVSDATAAPAALAALAALAAELPPPPPLELSRSASTALPDDLRSRASQAATLLAIVLTLVDTLRPEVLR